MVLLCNYQWLVDCFVLHLINLPIFVTLTMYDHPLCSVLLAYTITACIHGPPLSHSMATVDPWGKESKSLWVSLPFKDSPWHVLAYQFSSSALMLMGSLLMVNRALTGLLNKCGWTMQPYTYQHQTYLQQSEINFIILKALLMVCFTNFIHASTCLLLWCWYEEVVAWSFQLSTELFKLGWYEICTFIWNYFLL